MNYPDFRKVTYQESAHFVRQHEALLFQRLNYFLISSAFLVTAFVVLLTNSFQKHTLSWDSICILFRLTILVGSIGFLLSWLFASINFHNSRTLKMSYKYLEDELENNLLEGSKDITKLPYAYIRDKIFRSGDYDYGVTTVIYYPIVALPTLFKKGKDYELPAPNTWVIPLCFAIFWLFALFIYLLIIGCTFY